MYYPFEFITLLAQYSHFAFTDHSSAQARGGDGGGGGHVWGQYRVLPGSLE